ncbi:MAG: UDP-2,3-diacylglucosamine diphosphatase [Acidobacteriota bacterium]
MSRPDGEAARRRRVELVVLSDLHLGTVGCQAKPLLGYLKSIEPGTLVLNGDIIDCWQFSRWYWPKGHMKVVQRILKMIAAGIPVYYVTGNHDEMLRRFAELHLGSFHLVNKVVLELDGRRAWIFHGDVFDVVMRHSRWLVKLGSLGYDLLILINRLANGLSELAGRGRISLSKGIKDGVKRAVAFIGDFERTAASLAAENGYDYAVCGHIHQPAIKAVATGGRTVTYLNSGDWVENLTALEYDRGRWTLFRYRDHEQELERLDPREEAEPEGETESLSLPAAAALLQMVRP